ncbi:hypothetical protein R3I93_019926 [Phoxinus phoxinus]
MIYLRI